MRFPFTIEVPIKRNPQKKQKQKKLDSANEPLKTQTMLIFQGLPLSKFEFEFCILIVSGYSMPRMTIFFFYTCKSPDRTSGHK